MRRNKDAMTDWKAPVRLITIETNSEGGPIRDVLDSVWTDSSSALVGSGRTVCEGSNEHPALWTERLVRRSSNFRGQHEKIIFEVDGRIVGHIPDQLVDRPSGRNVRVEVKGYKAFGNSWLVDKLDAIRRAYAQYGALYEPSVAADFNAPPIRANVNDIWAARRKHYSAQDAEAVATALGRGVRTLVELDRILGGNRRRTLYAMHAADLITIDIKSAPLGDLSPVYFGPVDLGSYARGSK